MNKLFSPTLFKRSLKANYKIVSIFTLVLFLYSVMIISMYNPEDMSAVKSLAEFKFPPELLNAMGFDLSVTTLTGFVSSFLYGMLMLLFPMISYIIIGNKLIASMADKGTLSCILSTPTSRKKVCFTQMVFQILGVAFIVAVSTVVIIADCQITNKGLLEVGAFLKLNLGLFLLHFALSSICFLSSCIFNDTGKSLAFGAGVPILFFVTNMLATAGEKFHWLKYFTLFTLFNSNDIIGGKSVWLPFLALFIIGTVLYTLSIIVFNKKDLCL